jgi:hypothetical protein
MHRTSSRKRDVETSKEGNGITKKHAKTHQLKEAMKELSCSNHRTHKHEDKQFKEAKNVGR